MRRMVQQIRPFSYKGKADIDVIEGKVDKIQIEKLLKEYKDKIITKRNEKRENYEQNEVEGYVKNYKALRHKDEPKYRKLKLENVHLSNIKRPTKFSGQLDINASTYNNDDNTTTNERNVNNRQDRQQ